MIHDDYNLYLSVRASLNRKAGVWQDVIEFIKSNFGSLEEAIKSLEQLASMSQGDSGEISAQAGAFDKAKAWTLAGLIGLAMGVSPQQVLAGDITQLRSQLVKLYGEGFAEATDQAADDSRERIIKMYKDKGINPTEEKIQEGIHKLKEHMYNSSIKDATPAQTKTAPPGSVAPSALDIEKQNLQKQRDARKPYVVQAQFASTEIQNHKQEISGMVEGGTAGAKVIKTTDGVTLIVAFIRIPSEALARDRMDDYAQRMANKVFDGAMVQSVLIFKDAAGHYAVYRQSTQEETDNLGKVLKQHEEVQKMLKSK